MQYYVVCGIIFLLASFVIGYLIGRMRGRKEGFNEGELYAPLELRKRGLENGWCPICASRLANHQFNHFIKSHNKKQEDGSFKNT